MGGAWACPGPHPARTDHTKNGWRHYVFVQHNQGIKLWLDSFFFLKVREGLHWVAAKEIVTT